MRASGLALQGVTEVREGALKWYEHGKQTDKKRINYKSSRGKWKQLIYEMMG